VIETTLGGEQTPTQRLEVCVMLDYLQKAKEYLWAFVEIGFLTVLTVILLYLILGANSGVFVSGVADNVLKFAGAIPEQSLVGLAIVLALVFLVAKRMR
jgi:hypothetical protein